MKTDSETARSSPEATPNRIEIRAKVQRACAIAHGCGTGMSANQLLALIYEKGLPSLEERERILAAKLADDAGDNAED